MPLASHRLTPRLTKPYPHTPNQPCAQVPAHIPTVHPHSLPPTFSRQQTPGLWGGRKRLGPGAPGKPDPYSLPLPLPSPASYAVQSCSVLTGELFAPCSVYLSPVPYFEQCRQDACRCGQPCLCATLAHYAHLCRRHGLPVDFRAHLPACGECPTRVPLREGHWKNLGSRLKGPPAPPAPAA